MENEHETLLPTRKSLLTRLKNWDDADGWRQFFETYWRLIYGVARRAGFNDAEAQDIVQDTIIGVARKMKSFSYDPAVGSFKGWLMLNIRSRIADHLRKRNAAGRVFSGAADESEFAAGAQGIESVADPVAANFEQVYEEQWEQNLLDTAVSAVKAQVSVKQFMMFDLYALKQQPMSKVTRALGVNAAQVYLAKHRVSRLIKEEVRRLERRMNSGRLSE
jgi:RNA polymerase sigma-70 factor (ECF subfamily)